MDFEKKCIALKVRSCADTGYVTTGPIEVKYIFFEDGGALDFTMESAEVGWESIRSSGRYYNTNNLLNSLLIKRGEIENIEQVFKYSEVSYWQFMPSYIWPDFYMATQLIEILQQLFTVCKVAKILVFRSEFFELDAVWTGVATEIARKKNLEIIFINYRRTTLFKLVAGLKKIRGLIHKFLIMNIFLKILGHIGFVILAKIALAMATRCASPPDIS
jgi:hypothetical protein